MMIVIGIFGAFFGILAHFRKSLRPGMMAHAFQDSLSGIALFFPGSDNDFFLHANSFTNGPDTRIRTSKSYQRYPTCHHRGYVAFFYQTLPGSAQFVFATCVFTA